MYALRNGISLKYFSLYSVYVQLFCFEETRLCQWEIINFVDKTNKHLFF